jgi:hypothetical protein
MMSSNEETTEDRAEAAIEQLKLSFGSDDIVCHTWTPEVLN